MTALLAASPAVVFGPLALLLVPALVLAWCARRLSHRSVAQPRGEDLERDLRAALSVAVAADPSAPGLEVRNGWRGTAIGDHHDSSEGDRHAT